MCTCKLCGVEKVRKDGARTPNGRRVYKVDGVGRRWNGLVCPECYSCTDGIRKGSDQSDLGPADVLYPPKMRACRSCKTPTANYFQCGACNTAKERLYPETYSGCIEPEMYSLETGNRHGDGFRW